jgi:hypothetical protein
LFLFASSTFSSSKRMNKTNLLESLSTSLQLLKDTSIETPSILGSIGYYFSRLVFLTNALIGKLERSSHITKDDSLEYSQLNDLIRLSTNIIMKLSSKSELCEILTKRDKMLESLHKLEDQLTSLSTVNNKSNLSSSSSFFFTNQKQASLSSSSRYTYEMDLFLSLSLLYTLRYYVNKFATDKYSQHLSTLSGLIEYLTDARGIITLPKCFYWNFDGMVHVSFRLFHTIFPERYQADSETGTGSSLSSSFSPNSAEDKENDKFNLSFHDSYRGIWNGQFVAVQKISSSSLKPSSSSKFFSSSLSIFEQNEVGLRECLSTISMISSLKSDYFLSFLGFSWDSSSASSSSSSSSSPDLYFLYSLASGGGRSSLYDSFCNPALSSSAKISLSVEQKVSILLDVTDAISFLHSHGIIHGRIKDSNIFLDENYRVKLSDYGYHSFLSNDSRSCYKGKHGIRWTPPEIIQYESQYEEYLTKLSSNPSSISNSEYLKLSNLSSYLTSYPLLPSIDVYAIGILTLVLLTETIPFCNIPLEEVVKGQLLASSSASCSPYIPATYPDIDILSPLLEEVLTPCISNVLVRPSIEKMKGIVEESAANTIARAQQKELSSYQDDLTIVKEEVKELEEKIIEKTDIVKKGKEIISRKEVDKFNITDVKIRREKEAEIQKAKLKLVTFQEELDGYKDDKEGAEHDL